jgi:hypothetical protein
VLVAVLQLFDDAGELADLPLQPLEAHDHIARINLSEAELRHLVADALTAASRQVVEKFRLLLGRCWNGDCDGGERRTKQNSWMADHRLPARSGLDVRYEALRPNCDWNGSAEFGNRYCARLASPYGQLTCPLDAMLRCSARLGARFTSWR